MAVKRKPEKTQNGNPHMLTRNQHVFPARSIKRFTGNDDRVSVLFKEGQQQGMLKRLGPKNKIFCADRVWDQRAENLGKQVEDRFQDLADRIVSGKTESIGPNDKIIVDEFFSLWEARSFFKNIPPQNQPVYGCTGEILSKDQQEILESRHCAYIGSDNTLSGRIMAGFGITKRSDRTFMQLKSLEWTIVESKEVGFIVPDFPSFSYVPVSDSICLIGLGQKVGTKLEIDKKVAEELNKSLLVNAKTFVFARNITKTDLYLEL
ncbi:MAG: hypothetical protein ACYDBP_06625 [Leptospirales bacterium]